MKMFVLDFIQCRTFQSVLYRVSNAQSVSRTIHCKYKYFDSTVQRAEDRRQKFYFCRLPFAVNVKLNPSYVLY